MSIGRTLARAVIGGYFITYGAKKLGLMGEGNVDGTAEWMESIGLRPGRRHAVVAGATEIASGTSLALGALTPLGAAGIVGTMTTAIWTVNAENGPWEEDNGIEYPLVLAVSALALVEVGPGELSVDRWLGLEARGGRMAAAALLAGTGASLLLYLSRPSEA